MYNNVVFIIYRCSMPGLTEKLFEKLAKKNQDIKVNDELLKWLNDDSEEYHNLLESVDNPISRTENLKILVLKLYKESKLRDLEFFKYLAWSDQGDLCRLIGYGEKQLVKWKEEKQKQSQEKIPANQKPQIISGDTHGTMEMEADRPRSGMHFLGVKTSVFFVNMSFCEIC